MPFPRKYYYITELLVSSLPFVGTPACSNAAFSMDSSSAEQLPLLGEALAAEAVTPAEMPAPAENMAEERLAALPEGRELAPMLQHYVTLKRKYPEHLLL